MAELQQTKNSFKFIGKVTRLDKDGAFNEQKHEGGKRDGDYRRSLRFGVKTSETNDMTVQMFDFEPQEVFMWNSEKRKKDKGYKGDRIPYEQWLEQHEELREQGYAVLQTRVGLEYGEDKKIVSKGLPSYVASKEIYNGISNGDSVVVEGEIRYGTYTDREGKTKEQKTFTIKKIFRLKDVDFETENFEEITFFEQEIVFVDAMNDTEQKKVIVTGRVIDFAKNFHDTQFVVDYSDGDSGMKKLASAFTKKFKFGDVLNVFGDALNRVIIEETEEEDLDDEAELLASLGGRKKPSHAKGFVTRDYISEMQIHGIDAWDKGVYEEDDFQKDELLEDGKEDLSDELGGKKKKANPFDTDVEGDDLEEDDLPF